MGFLFPYRSVFPALVGAILLLHTPALHAEKKRYNESDAGSISNFVARKKKGYSYGCFQSSRPFLTKSKALKNGSKLDIHDSDSALRASVNRMNQRRKRLLKRGRLEKGTVKWRKLAEKIRFASRAIGHCSEDDDSGGGSGGGGSDGGGDSSGFRHRGPEQAQIGSNTNWANYYTSEIKFCDLFKQSREMVPVTNDVFNTGSLVLRDDGYPTYLPQGNTTATTVVGYQDQGLRMPAGDYTFSFEGQGQIVLSGDGITERLYDTAGTYAVTVSPNASGIWFSLIRSEASDPIRNIKFIIPGLSDSCTESSPFYQPFIDFVSNFTVIRTMNMLEINDGSYPCDDGSSITSINCEKSWANRQTTSFQTQGGRKGTAIEYVIGIANTARVNLWFNMQHAATDDYIRGAAALICSQLSSDLRVYFQYSNEVWNHTGAFPQSQWADAIEAAEGLTRVSDPLAGQRAYVRRVMRMYEIVEEECSDEQAINVLGGFSGIPSVNSLNLADFQDASINTAGVQPEALAVAYYTGIFIVDHLESSGQRNSSTVTQILDYASRNIDEDIDIGGGETEEALEPLMQQINTMAENAGIPLITYEGGQHIVAQSWENPPVLSDKVIEANRDAGMYDVYVKLLDSWFNTAGGLFIHFGGVVETSDSLGAFGSKEYLEQPLAEAHKFRSLIERQQALGALPN